MRQPTFKNIAEMKVVGLGSNFHSILSPKRNNHVVIPDLWKRFFPRMHEVRSKPGAATVGMVDRLSDKSLEQSGECFYLAGVEVDNFDVIPTGMMTRTVPPGRYAVFVHAGKLDSLGQTMSDIYQTWLPASGLKLRNAPEIEMYERFIPDSDRSEMDIYIPVS